MVDTECAPALYAWVVLRNALRSLWAEPRAPDPPLRVWRDWALVGVLVLGTAIEASLRDDVVWRPVSLVLALGLALPLLYRRTKPLAAVAGFFGAIIVLDVASILRDAGPVGLYISALVLLLPYSLFRWGSGREAVIGLPIMLVAAGLGIASDYTGVVDAVAGMLFLLFWAVLGASVRYAAASRLRQMDQIKLREREQLARELHDTVAHHVSAIAIRAQAGRVVAASDPSAALEALDVIEAEASRTLAEMRTMVGTLRQGEAPDLAPRRGVADLELLARSVGTSPPVDVELSGALNDLTPSVGAAIYRIAQESITNAIRHARHASRIDVRVLGEASYVRLTVSDDGDSGSSSAGTSSGYGIAGMAERAKLLGGTLEAGPRSGGGWTVDAVLPRNGSVR